MNYMNICIYISWLVSLSHSVSFSFILISLTFSFFGLFCLRFLGLTARRLISSKFIRAASGFNWKYAQISARTRRRSSSSSSSSSTRRRCWLRLLLTWVRINDAWLLLLLRIVLLLLSSISRIRCSAQFCLNSSRFFLYIPCLISFLFFYIYIFILYLFLFVFFLTDFNGIELFMQQLNLCPYLLAYFN